MVTEARLIKALLFEKNSIAVFPPRRKKDITVLHNIAKLFMDNSAQR
jgi:hypothetical protein